MLICNLIVGGRKYLTNRGFTIVEMIVTMMIMGVIIASFASAIVGIKVIFGRASSIASANTLAYAKLQEYENRTFASIPSTAITNPATLTEQEDFTASLPASMPSPRSAKVFTSSQSTSLKLITVRIRFGTNVGNVNCTGSERCVEYTSLVQQRGLGR